MKKRAGKCVWKDMVEKNEKELAHDCKMQD
jgi:hypothetical protein